MQRVQSLAAVLRMQLLSLPDAFCHVAKMLAITLSVFSGGLPCLQLSTVVHPAHTRAVPCTPDSDPKDKHTLLKHAESPPDSMISQGCNNRGKQDVSADGTML